MVGDKAKAWKVEWEDCEDRCEIVFAATRNEARRAADTQDAEWLQVTAKRAPKFDGLTDPRALAMMQLLEGWWFFCGDCEHKVDVDGCWSCAEEEAGEGECAGARLVDAAQSTLIELRPAMRFYLSAWPCWCLRPPTVVSR